jgi:hypothetical protein
MCPPFRGKSTYEVFSDAGQDQHKDYFERRLRALDASIAALE